MRPRPYRDVSGCPARAGGEDACAGRKPNPRDARDRTAADALGLLGSQEMAEAGSVQFGPAATLNELLTRSLGVSEVASHEPVNGEVIGWDGDDGLALQPEQSRRWLGHAGADERRHRTSAPQSRHSEYLFRAVFSGCQRTPAERCGHPGNALMMRLCGSPSGTGATGLEPATPGFGDRCSAS